LSVRFGEFTLDTERRQLFRHDQELHLPPKALELLMAPVDSRPRAASKTELLERIWPGTFVSEDNLSTLVAAIRSVLEDTRRPSRYIRTVHGFGYAFEAAATELARACPDVAANSVTYWLIVETRQIALTPGQNLVGRDPHNTVWLAAPSVSRRHARIVITPSCVTVEDLNSKNGTHLRRARVTKSPSALRDGDGIRFGSVQTTFRILLPETTATEPQEFECNPR
jgi:DNA-binding winged helix-turn-helix (wHTH) protein